MEQEKAKDEAAGEKTAKKSDAKKKLEEYLETIQRLQADFENYKKRVEKERVESQKYSSAQLLAKILPVLDSFEMALKNSNVQDHEKFVKGMELVYAQLCSALHEEGLFQISSLGKKFDPYRHEVIMQEKSENDGIVLEEFQKGYMLKDKVLRHSKVKIGRNAEDGR